MIISIGEILFDRFDTHKRMGGAPFNVAFHLKKLGFPVRFISRVGDDIDGQTVISFLSRHGFDVTDIQIDPLHQTGIVIVTLDDKGVPDFEILPDAAFDHLQLPPEILAANPGPVDLICLGSVFQRTEKAAAKVDQFLNTKDSKTKIMVDLNLRKNCYSREQVLSTLAQANILKVNHSELSVIREMSGLVVQTETRIDDVMKKFDIEVMAVTRGEAGSLMVQNENHYTIDLFEPIDRMADTVGAGDGFSAILIAGYLSKWPPDKILTVATDFATEICKIDGALPETDLFYKAFRRLIS